MSENTSPQAQPNGRPKKNSIGSWFSKKFGRRTSDALTSQSANNSSATGTMSLRKGARNAPHDKVNTLSNINGGANTANGGPQPQSASAFTFNQPHSLANTLTVSNDDTPAQGRLTPPPQLDGIPSQEPLGAIDLPRSPRPDNSPVLMDKEAGTLSPSADINMTPLGHGESGATDTVVHSGATSTSGPTQTPGAAASIPGAIISATSITSEAIEADTDDESSLAGRDSIGNRTMDTSKSRASTKPTTLMSLETREPTVLPTTHIAQPRRSAGEDSFGASPHLSTGPREGSAIHFASNNASRNSSGQIVTSGSIINEGGPNFINVPTHSRPHPNNNPHPSGIPADNASVLTLASSTAGVSLGGASRHHHAPSLGGARSIGGSLMGDRRNSSDTYASLRALPPLSRRGSDSSSRTRDSVAASSTGQTSNQAMYAQAGTFAAPGAPSDRVSLHRTPSQKTVATQLSVPLSSSASNPAPLASARSEHAANGSQPHLATSQTEHVTDGPQVGQHNHIEAMLAIDGTNMPKETVQKPLEASAITNLVESYPETETSSAGLLEAQASNLAATGHDKTLHEAAAAQETQPVASAMEENEFTKEHIPFDVPGGPPVA
ncbi:uncharacterized protein MEPE_00419 [Melanopsichium pennsylvanicum]|uniref:Uncharacterized protein n=2 Tax=Melanopsichium pennsylvanicum TaxID=63383 RepID=A0AAJ4XFU9_9BASI|nr:putative protein [Melanopsichium pennsylvanicum 4]SNX81714.1 uncharacterized protein MEPE_00419 [Melanopsichium pennsylvanicum]